MIPGNLVEISIGHPIANMSFAALRQYIRAMQRRGVDMLHTARPFSHYRKVFYGGRSESAVLRELQGKRIVDIGCGYTPYVSDSMFQVCNAAGIDFYGVDPLIGKDVRFSIRDKLLARSLGSRGHFNKNADSLSNAIATTAQDLPFEDSSVDEILCSYLLFVWIEYEQTLADIFSEFYRVLKPDGVAKLYPLYEWRFVRIKDPKLQDLLQQFEIHQTYLRGDGSFRLGSSFVTELHKLSD